MSLGSRIPTLVLVAVYVAAGAFVACALAAALAPTLPATVQAATPTDAVALAVTTRPAATQTPTTEATSTSVPTLLAATPTKEATATLVPTLPEATQTPASEATLTDAAPHATATLAPTLPGTPPVRVLRTCPIDDDTDLLPAAPLHIVFDQPMDTDPAAVQVSLTPELPFGIEWLTPEDLLITTAPREPGIRYLLTVQGVRSQLGGALEHPLTLTFGQGGEGAPIPILMYHHIRDLAADASAEVRRWTVSPQNLAEQLDLLTSLGVHIVSLDEVASYLRGGEPLPARPLALTFDDGYVSAYKNAVPAMQERGMTATFFVPVAFVGEPAYMNWDELRSLAAAGFSIGGHGYEHVRIDALGAAEAERHLGEAKRLLEAETGVRVTAFAYPFGNYSASAMDQLSAYGFETGLTSNLLVRQKAGGLLSLRRIYMSYDEPALALQSKLPW